MKVVLYINAYESPDQDRNRELKHVLLLNVGNPSIDSIVAFYDTAQEQPKFSATTKIKWIGFFGRPAYSDFFNYINLNQSKDQISIIANADIQITESAVLLAKKFLSVDQCWALAWYKIHDGGMVQLNNRADAQDSWFFRGHIKPVMNCSFTMGVPGCDNAIAERLLRAGYEVLNPSIDVMTIHHHKSEVRTYDKNVRIEPPIYRVWPHDVLNQKILHIGLFNDKEPQTSLRKALKEVSSYYEEYDWHTTGSINSFISKKLDTKMFNTVFMQIQTTGVIAPDLLKKYSEKGIRFFNFNGDVRIPFPEWYKDVAPYSTALYTNMDDVEEIRAIGHEAHHFQIGYNEDFYSPNGGKVFNHPAVTFIANNHIGNFPLSNLREQVVDQLRKEFDADFVVYGNGWMPAAKDLNFKQKTEGAVYRSALMAINLSHVDAGRYTSDRMFRIMACGCLCLAYDHRDMAEDFIDGIHLRTWKTIDELKNLIFYYLDKRHEGERFQIAQAGMKRVQKYYTWDYRFREDFRNILVNGTTKPHEFE